MKRLIDWVRFIFISPEALVSLLIIVLRVRHPSLVGQIGQKFAGDLHAVDGLLAIPCGLAYFAYDRIKAILFPDATIRKKLQEWPDFHRLFDRVLFAFALISVCAAGTIVLRLFADQISEINRGFLYIFALSLSVTPIPSLIITELQIRCICDAYSTTSKD